MGLKERLAYCYRRCLTLISPKLNTAAVYKARFGRKLDLNHPETLNEKILWLKFNAYMNNPLVKQCADKYRVRKYVEESGCSEFLNDLIGVYSNPEEIDWDSLPNRFAIKMNVGCGYNHIVFDKSQEDKTEVLSEIENWFKKAPKTWLGYSEMQYKDVDPVVLIEKYLGGDNGELPNDYKFYCINGKCCMTMFCSDRDKHGHGAKYYYMDREWNMITNSIGDSTVIIDKPVMLEDAMRTAEILSKPFPFVRVDLYLLGTKIVFGELTFTPAAGMDVDHKLVPFNGNKDIDHIYGKLLQLPISN